MVDERCFWWRKYDKKITLMITVKCQENNFNEAVKFEKITLMITVKLEKIWHLTVPCSRITDKKYMRGNSTTLHHWVEHQRSAALSCPIGCVISGSRDKQVVLYYSHVISTRRFQYCSHEMRGIIFWLNTSKSKEFRVIFHGKMRKECVFSTSNMFFNEIYNRI